MDYSTRYIGCTPADMSLADFKEVVFELFPRKVSTEPDNAAKIIVELKAFWQFIDRQYTLPAARAILNTLDDDSVRQLKDALADPSSYGMAKSFFMMGKKAGFDMTTQEGLNEFMLAYNTSLLAARATRDVLSPSNYWNTPGLPYDPLRKERRKKRKLQRQAQKRRRQ